MKVENENNTLSLAETMSNSNMYLERAYVLANELSSYFRYCDVKKNESEILYYYDKSRILFDILFDYLVQTKESHEELSKIIDDIRAEKRREGNVL